MTGPLREDGHWHNAQPYTHVFLTEDSFLSAQATGTPSQAVAINLGHGVTVYLDTTAADRLYRLLGLAIADRVDLEAQAEVPA